VAQQGKEAILAILDVGDFFGEGCLTGQPLRMGLEAPSGSSSRQRDSGNAGPPRRASPDHGPVDRRR